MGEFAASIERSKAKSVSASGGLRPRPPDQGLCPWAPMGAPPSDPCCRLALSPCPLLPNPKYATDAGSYVMNSLLSARKEKILSCPNRSQYGSRPSVRPSVCPSCSCFQFVGLQNVSTYTAADYRWALIVCYLFTSRRRPLMADVCIGDLWTVVCLYQTCAYTFTATTLQCPANCPSVCFASAEGQNFRSDL